MSGGQRRPAHPVRDPRETPEVTDALTIPADLLPSDGRFGCGPSRCARRRSTTSPPWAPASWAPATARPRSRVWWARSVPACGTSFCAARGYEVIVGNGGATAFWDIAAFGLVRERAQHLAFGEFSAKFGSVTSKAPFLGESTIIKGDPARSRSQAEAGIDVYAWAHKRPPPASWHPSAGSGAPTRALSCSSTRPPAPAGSPSTRPRPMSTTSLRRSASPPTVGCGGRCSPQPLSPASRRSRRPTAGCRTSSASRRRSTTRSGPDLQHSGRRVARPHGQPGRVAQRAGRALVGCQAHR